MIIALAVWLIGIPLAFPPALWLLIASVRAGLFHMPWWGVPLAALGIAVAWPWGLWSFL
jgi:hypothetical protein